MGKEEAAGAANGVALRGDLSVGASGVVIVGGRGGGRGRGRWAGAAVAPRAGTSLAPGGSGAGVAGGAREAVGGTLGPRPPPAVGVAYASAPGERGRARSRRAVRSLAR